MEATASKLEIDAVVLASAGDEPQLKRILCVSTNGWIKRYRSDPASASVELTVEWAETTMRLAEMIDRRQVGLAGNPPPPVPPTADGGHDDAGTVDVKIAHEKAAVRARVADADGDAARKGVRNCPAHAMHTHDWKT
jgi:hypothetical protein